MYVQCTLYILQMFQYLERFSLLLTSLMIIFRAFIQKLCTNWRTVEWKRFAIFGQENSVQQKDYFILVQKLPLWVSKRKAVSVTSIWWWLTSWYYFNVKLSNWIRIEGWTAWTRNIYLLWTEEWKTITWLTVLFLV